MMSHLSENLFPQILFITISTAAAWLFHSTISRRMYGKEPSGARRTAKTVILRFLTRPAGPLLLLLLLWITRWFFIRWGVSADLIDTLVPLVGFFILYQFISEALSILLEQRRLHLLLSQMIAALGVVALALNMFGVLSKTWDIIDHPFLKLGAVQVSLGNIITTIFLFILLLIVSGQITDFVQRRLISKTDIDPNLSFVLMRFLKVLFFAFGTLIIISTAGIDLSALAIFGGAVGIGLGFGLQNIASNLVSGLILLLDRSIKKGDVITVGDSYGWVEKMQARYIVVQARDGLERLIPNANLISSEIINWSHTNRAVRLSVKVGVSYLSDPSKVRDILLNVAAQNPRILTDPPPAVMFMDFGNSSLDFELRYWINDPQEGISNIGSFVRFEIWKAFKENGIEIPYPQRDIHIRSGLEGFESRNVP